MDKTISNEDKLLVNNKLKHIFFALNEYLRVIADYYNNVAVPLNGLNFKKASNDIRKELNKLCLGIDTTQFIGITVAMDDMDGLSVKVGFKSMSHRTDLVTLLETKILRDLNEKKEED